MGMYTELYLALTLKKETPQGNDGHPKQHGLMVGICFR